MNAELWTGPPGDPQRYRVRLTDGHPVAEPGGGGDGFVYRARTADDRQVALKLLLHTRPSGIDELTEGVEAIAGIVHDHLMTPVEAFVGPALTDDADPPDEAFDVCWIVAEWVEGRPLTDEIEERDEADALRLVAQVARGVAELHGASPTALAHRDMKPSNVRVTPEGAAIVIDYGSAGSHDPVRAGGTPGWVAPEVATGDAPTTAADVWGVGALAHHALVGSPPRHDGAACARERMEFIGRRVGLPRCDEVARHIAPLLESDPAARPTDLRQWADQLDAVIDGRRPARPGRRRLIALVVLVLLAAAAITFALVRDDGADGRETDATATATVAVAGSTTVPCSHELGPTAPPTLAAAVAVLEPGMCATGTVESFVDARVAPLETTDGTPAGVMILCPGNKLTRLTATEYASYREIAGRSQPENSVTYGGYPETRRTLADPTGVMIELSSGGLILGPRDDTQQFWVPKQARALWESEGGVRGRLGFPMSNVFLSGQELRLEFEHGYLTAALDEAAPGVDSWIPFDVDRVEVVHVDDPSADIGPLGDLRGKVLRQAGGTAWFVDDDLVRHWIPDGGTYECLDAEARTVGGNVPGYAVATLELGAPATCAMAD